MSHILIVEDEEKLARFLELELTHEGYTVEKAGNGPDAVGAVSRGMEGEGQAFDLVLLDVMLPGINGMEVLRRIKQSEDAPPVIMLTARDQVMDKVAGLDAGAVDYITKPFAIEELLARIRVALKLHPAGHAAGAAREGNARTETAEGVLTWDRLTLDIPRHRVMWDGDEIALTNREFMMLQTLLENRGIVLSRDVLLSKVCGYDYVGETNVIDVYVRYLRTKIDEVYDVKMIRTVRGVGYVIDG
ncbi:MAG: response regulator transcription factor [Lachnospiraceae bacterium]|nr:response regulator transcription factor [Lachnospiraceae bacterium]